MYNRKQIINWIKRTMNNLKYGVDEINAPETVASPRAAKHYLLRQSYNFRVQHYAGSYKHGN
jgi:hypothetical protein